MVVTSRGEILDRGDCGGPQLAAGVGAQAGDQRQVTGGFPPLRAVARERTGRARRSGLSPGRCRDRRLGRELLGQPDARVIDHGCDVVDPQRLQPVVAEQQVDVRRDLHPDCRQRLGIGGELQHRGGAGMPGEFGVVRLVAAG